MQLLKLIAIMKLPGNFLLKLIEMDLKLQKYKEILFWNISITFKTLKIF